MALMRALTEVNQFLPAVSERKPDGSTLYWMDDPDAIQWWTEETLERNPHVAPTGACPRTATVGLRGDRHR